MAGNKSRTLPDYDNPPVAEVVAGISFAPLTKLLVPHVGRYWDKFKSQFPNCNEVAPLPVRIEHFDKPPELIREAGDHQLPRVWFISSDDNEIVQLQRDKLLYNWRKIRDEDDYPRYQKVMQSFYSKLSDFKDFIRELDLGEVSPIQYEMTYVNHILIGEGWDSMSDIGNVFPDYSWEKSSDRFLSLGREGINWRDTYELPERHGRLSTTIRNGYRSADNTPTLHFELTVRGFPATSSEDDMQAWFDLAREWIVHGFTDLTGPGIQKSIWGRK